MATSRGKDLAVLTLREASARGFRRIVVRGSWRSRASSPWLVEVEPARTALHEALRVSKQLGLQQ